MGCHDGKYAVGTKTGDKLCAPCRGVQGAGEKRVQTLSQNATGALAAAGASPVQPGMPAFSWAPRSPFPKPGVEGPWPPPPLHAAAGPASASPLTPGADAAAPLVKRQRRHGSQEAGPGEEAEPSSGPATEQGAGAAAGSKRKRSTSPSQAQEATTEEQKAPTAEKQGRADKGSVKKKAHKLVGWAEDALLP